MRDNIYIVYLLPSILTAWLFLRHICYRVTIFLERKSGTRFTKQWNARETQWWGVQTNTFIY
jgi:hypothetical protein